MTIYTVEFNAIFFPTKSGQNLSYNSQTILPKHTILYPKQDEVKSEFSHPRLPPAGGVAPYVCGGLNKHE